VTLHGHHLIGLERRRDTPAHHHAYDPDSGATLEPTFADASPAEIDAALELATTAHLHASGISAEQRAAFLDRIAEQIEAIGEPLIERAMLETGLPRARLLGERDRTVTQLRSFSALVREGSWVGARIDRAQPDRTPTPRPDLRSMLVPLGPVAVFGASNFPLAFSVAGGDSASAFAAGCPVIVKAHPSHPGTSELVAEAIVAAVRASDLHPGSFALLHGAGHVVGQALVRHPSLRAVGFTGSLRGGRALCEIAAARPQPIPVFDEMGSINPVFLLPGALADRHAQLARAAAASLTLGVGQFCTNPGVLLVPVGSDGDAFVHELAQAITSAPAGVMLDANILANYRSGLAHRDQQAGVARVAAGLGQARRAEPVVFVCDAARFIADPTLHEELFGPAALVVRWRSETDELLEIATSLAGQLSASVHTNDADLAGAGRLTELLRDRVGRLIWNGFPTGVEVAPAMQHGGPWPASSDARTTSVGTAAIERFARPSCFQDVPPALLPAELHDSNPRGISRLVDGRLTRDAL
jgi:2,5-dioxopentanoate dehydrogenase